MVSLLIIVARISEPISNFLAITGSIDIMSVAFTKIKEVLGVSKLEVETPTKLPTAFDIQFNDVCFSYQQNHHQALNQLSFSIKNHSLTAIVGNSGCGKTTLTKMIMRYADPQKGDIKIGGVTIKNMTQSELMSHISVVFQDVYLFDDTILNNIRMGNPYASDKEVKEASKAAHCHEFIQRLPKGYETKVGDIGGSLSGGEKQRVSIARAILKDAPIVILDEPTSALDTQSEIVVQKALDALIKNKTVIVIAHRLSTICHADNILVLDQGKLKEQGTHQELLHQQGKYYEMYQAQQRIKQWNIINE
jgi:ATP-binding cassette subfamily B protein